jgi:hypothetical protein
MRNDTKETSGRKRRLLAFGIVTAILVGGTGAAYAYWTNTGSGTGSGATGTNVPITINQTSTVTAMGPGVAAQALSGTFTNPNAGPVYVASITVSIGTITVGGSPAVGCSATDYVITGSPITVNASVTTGTAWSGATIAFVNKPAVNQDGCKNATVNLVYSSN